MSEQSPYRWIEEARLAEPKTKFPFAATINGERVIVWDDEIEYPPRDLPWTEEEEGGWLEGYVQDKA